MIITRLIVILSVLLIVSGCGSPRESAAASAKQGENVTPRSSKRVEGPVPREFIERNDEGAVRDSIRNGADVNAAYDKYGMNALHLATTYRAADVLTALLESGAEVDAATTQGWTPLINAVLIDEWSLADILLAHGADPNLRDGAGETALLHAAQMGFDLSSQVLIRHGADLSATDPSGETALHKAAKNQKDSATMVRLLLEQGADPTVRNAQGQTPHDVAQQAGCDRLATILE